MIHEQISATSRIKARFRNLLPHIICAALALQALPSPAASSNNKNDVSTMSLDDLRKILKGEGNRIDAIEELGRRAAQAKPALPDLKKRFDKIQVLNKPGLPFSMGLALVRGAADTESLAIVDAILKIAPDEFDKFFEDAVKSDLPAKTRARVIEIVKSYPEEKALAIFRTALQKTPSLLVENDIKTALRSMGTKGQEIADKKRH